MSTVSYTPVLPPSLHRQPDENFDLDFYTLLFRGTIESGSSNLLLSSTTGVYEGRILYTSDMEDYFTILAVDHEASTVTIDGSFNYTATNVIVTIE